MLVEVKLEDSSWWKGTVVRQTSKVGVKRKHAIPPNHWCVRGHNGAEMDLDFNKMDWRQAREEDAEVCVVVVPRHLHQQPRVEEAKQKELGLLRQFDTYEEVHLDDISDGVKKNIMDLTWVVTEKDVGEIKVTKARLCVRGYQEKAKIRRDSPTVSKSGLRLLLAVSSSMGWEIESLDAKSAFLQGDIIYRLVYVYPPKESEAGDRVIWKLKKRLYGLGDVSQGWKGRNSILPSMSSRRTGSCQEW